MNPANAGRAEAVLREAGVEVRGGVLRAEAECMLEPFFKFIRTGRPFVTLKMAQSLDGAIADHAGASKWITGPEARDEVARMRRRADVVMVGSGTILADDPSLMRRSEPEGGLPGMRCALDARCRIGSSAKIFSDGHAERTIVATARDASPERVREWERLGAAAWRIAPALPQAAAGGAARPLSLPALMEKFGREGFMHVLCEGGAALASALVSEGLVDELRLFVAPVVLGRPSLGVFGSIAHDLPTAPRFGIISERRFGEDILLVMRPKP